MDCPNLEDEGVYFFRNLRNNLPSSAGTLPRWTASLISGCVYCFKLWQTLTKRSSGTLYGSDFPSFKLALRLTSLKDLKRLRICCAKYTPAKKMAWRKIIYILMNCFIYIYIYIYIYIGCPRRNVPDFGRVFLMLKYTDITQKTYI